MKAFESCHPAVNFIYFALVLAFTVSLMNPVCLILSAAAAFAYSFYLRGKDESLRNLKYQSLVFLLVAIINPLFNHEGVTTLAYFPGGNPFTMESLIYGLCSGLMMVAVFTWFSCFTKILTGEKLMCLFGKLAPSLSIVLSMSLRFLPRFREQYGNVRQARKCLGADPGEGSILKRIRNEISVLSIMISWALENAVDTADSMKSRGYGLHGRTAFSIYRFSGKDGLLTSAFCLLSTFVIFAKVSDVISWKFFPRFKLAPLTPLSAAVYAVYLVLMLIPLALDIAQDRAFERSAAQSVSE